MMRPFMQRLADLIAPRSCAVCGKRLVVGEQLLCTTCLRHLPRTHHASHPLDNEMARLFWHLLPVEGAAAWLFHEGGSPSCWPVYALKYLNRPEYGEALGLLMARETSETAFFDGIDLIVPVPLAPVRQRQRGYNQSLLITRGIARQTGLTVAEGAVGRTQFEKSQTHLSRSARQQNVEDVFRLLDSRCLQGKHVLLVDDVCTSGATLLACGREIMRGGAARLSLLTLGFAGHV